LSVLRNPWRCLPSQANSRPFTLYDIDKFNVSGSAVDVPANRKLWSFSDSKLRLHNSLFQIMTTDFTLRHFMKRSTSQRTYNHFNAHRMDIQLNLTFCQ
jgi:hypothetical protein